MRTIKQVNDVVRPVIQRKRIAQDFFSFVYKIDLCINLNCASPITKNIFLFLSPHEVYFMRKGNVLKREIFLSYVNMYTEWKMEWAKKLKPGNLVDAIMKKDGKYSWAEARVYPSESTYRKDVSVINGSPFAKFIFRESHRYLGNTFWGYYEKRASVLIASYKGNIYPVHTKTIPWRHKLKIGSLIEVFVESKGVISGWHKAIVVNLEVPKTIYRGRWVDDGHCPRYYKEFCAACFTMQKEYHNTCSRCRQNSRGAVPSVEIQEAGNLQLRLMRCKQKECICTKRLSMVWNGDKTKKNGIHFIPTYYKGEMGYINRRGYIALSNNSLRPIKNIKY